MMPDTLRISNPTTTWPSPAHVAPVTTVVIQARSHKAAPMPRGTQPSAAVQIAATSRGVRSFCIVRPRHQSGGAGSPRGRADGWRRLARRVGGRADHELPWDRPVGGRSHVRSAGHKRLAVRPGVGSLPQRGRRAGGRRGTRIGALRCDSHAWGVGTAASARSDGDRVAGLARGRFCPHSSLSAQRCTRVSAELEAGCSSPPTASISA
jgi:hypothetical protein